MTRSAPTGAEPVVEDPAPDPIQAAARLQTACIARQLTVATAESCTGGAVASAITANPGSSGYFRGGVVSYADEVKRDLLAVTDELLAAHGAVSAQVAMAMAAGATRALGADMAVATTGVAGPDGGTPDKPVGLVYVAVHDAAGSDVRRFQWTGDRASNIAATVAAALDLLLTRVSVDEDPERSA
jgi:PncC family amidohydrolase